MGRWDREWWSGSWAGDRGRSEEVTCLPPESKVMPSLAIAKGQSWSETLKQLRRHDLMSVAPVITEGWTEAYDLGAR